MYTNSIGFCAIERINTIGGKVMLTMSVNIDYVILII